MFSTWYEVCVFIVAEEIASQFSTWPSTVETATQDISCREMSEWYWCESLCIHVLVWWNLSNYEKLKLYDTCNNIVYVDVIKLVTSFLWFSRFYMCNHWSCTTILMCVYSYKITKGLTWFYTINDCQCIGVCGLADYVCRMS